MMERLCPVPSSLHMGPRVLSPHKVTSALGPVVSPAGGGAHSLGVQYRSLSSGGQPVTWPSPFSEHSITKAGCPTQISPQGMYFHRPGEGDPQSVPHMTCLGHTTLVVPQQRHLVMSHKCRGKHPRLCLLRGSRIKGGTAVAWFAVQDLNC